MRPEEIHKAAIKWKDERCDLVHVASADFSDLPDDKVEKVYGICFRDKKILMVYHSEWDIWGIPGGTREKDESVLDTLKREINEETGYHLSKASPTLYQKVQHSDGSFYYILYYSCEVTDGDIFTGDIAGTITKYEWVDMDKYHLYVEQKPFRQKVIEDAISLYLKM